MSSKINIATTFSKDGYKLYGKKWIETVKLYWPDTCNVFLYTDFYIEDLPSNFTLLNFIEEFPNHPNLIDRVNKKYITADGKHREIAAKTIKFSYKGFVILNQLFNNRTNAEIFVWLDGDVETISNINYFDIQNVMEGKFLACQTEKQTHRYPHIESGILIFNLYHPLLQSFKNCMFEYYNTDKLFSLKKPYDGYVIGKVIKEKQLPIMDFNKDITVIGKNSNKDCTFKHPFLSDRFVHWIGGVKNHLML